MVDDDASWRMKASTIKSWQIKTWQIKIWQIKIWQIKSWRIKSWRAALALASALTLASLGGPAAHAQNFARPPSINIPSRVPTITPTVTPRATINPNVAGAATAVGRITPNLKTYQGCS